MELSKSLLFEHKELQMNAPLKRPSTHSLVKHIKQVEQDFEWYPTTTEILEVIKTDIDAMVEDLILDQSPSILDCGAGDGRSLMYLTKGKRYAIEKSRPLLTAMDRSIFIIGADFHQQTLMDKVTSLCFSNPPFSEFVAWSTKIIKETRAGYVYLVIPERWKKSDDIQNALELRSAEAEIIGTFDFYSADRAARAKADIVKVSLVSKRWYSREASADTDPFKMWFNENFKIDTSSTPESNGESTTTKKEKIAQELVNGNDIVTTLTQLYDRDLEHLIKNYKALELLDPSLLRELDVSFNSLREAFQGKIKGLKNLYWNELFNNLTKITDKLTKGSRENMLNTLTARTDVDFNNDNIYAVVIWVIKNANVYYDNQLINLVERMVEKANVVLYKSNQRTFADEQWRYYRHPEGLEQYSLDYRIILERVGGLASTEWIGEYSRHNGLKESAYYFIMDILTVATNIGFDTSNRTTPSDFQWESNKGHDFYCYDYTKQKEVILMSVKAFMNGNLHVKFAPKFIMRLNVEFGRLKGWVKDAQEAADEMDIEITDAMESFNSNLKLSSDNFVKLGFMQAA
tara:strand:- start:327 stop:2045 length:1719 start_codon:yes stop_codon:yes gene_type:complete